jgi:hypothetical protein
MVGELFHWETCSGEKAQKFPLGITVPKKVFCANRKIQVPEMTIFRSNSIKTSSIIIVFSPKSAS